MSLKAKIEAVIYASEEPVTLAQLTGLLGQEGQAELDAIAAQQHSLALEAEAEPIAAPGTALDPEALNDEVIVNEVTDLEDGESEGIAPEAAEEPAPPADPEQTPVILSEDKRSESQSKDPEAVGPATTSETLSGDETPATETPTAAPAKPTEAEQKLAARKLRDYFRSLLDQLIADYANGDRGLEIREVANGFRLATKPEYHDAVRGFVKSLKPPLKLTLQALETLAVVAYKQPVTAPEVSEIRGVDSGGVLGSLLGRKLVTTAGRKQVIGRPILYKTTKDFLLRFGLKDINELPSIEEFEKMTGELNDAVQEEMQMEQHPGPTEPGSETSEESGPDPIELEGHNLQPIQTSVILSEDERSESQSKDPEAVGPTTIVNTLSNEEITAPHPGAPTSEPEPDPEA